MPELSVDHLLSVEQAVAILDAVELKPRVVQVSLLEASDLRLAEDVFSDRDYPPFDKAVMDGYAIRSIDAGVGARLIVVDCVAAGQVGQLEVGAGQAVKIMTGAPLPSGADAVVPIEQTKREGSHVILDRQLQPDHAVAHRGSDTLAHRLLLTKGTRLGPAQIGVAASVGKAVVAVYAAPRVSVLTTGDEIIEMNRSPIGSQIRNSNGPMMAALLKRLGCDVRNLGIVRDNPDEIQAAIATGLDSDALFITGGMSMGEYDYVPRLLRERGMNLLISKLRIKPGKPFAFATGQREGKNPAMVFGLPGNPVSAFVCTLILAGRILKRLMGGSPEVEMHECDITHDLPANGPREFYLPAFQTGDRVQPLQPNGSADLFTLSQANCLIRRSEEATAVQCGQKIHVIKLPYY